MIAIPVVRNVLINMKSKFEIKSIEAVTAYQNEDIIYRFTELFNITEEEAREIFSDCLKWLWLIATAQYERSIGLPGVPTKIAIDNSLGIIDEMWHNFLCFTKEYQSFCRNNFGIFIHHNPTSKSFNEDLKKQIGKSNIYQRKRRETQYSYIYEKLGEDVLVKWYEFYDKKYTRQKIKSLRKN
ncbi:MAG TPA: hypothetical protein VNW95_09550 [Mucilaginibacter sp.]|jgi:hypothetical protein|nr:hypothetical protein [Mucilaginibacter sp.]